MEITHFLGKVFIRAATRAMACVEFDSAIVFQLAGDFVKQFFRSGAFAHGVKQMKAADANRWTKRLCRFKNIDYSRVAAAENQYGFFATDYKILFVSKIIFAVLIIKHIIHGGAALLTLGNCKQLKLIVNLVISVNQFYLRVVYKISVKPDVNFKNPRLVVMRLKS